MRKIAVAGIVWLGLVAGLLAVAIANRPDHETVFTPGPGVGALDKLLGGTSKDVQASLLSAWSSTYTLTLVLGTIVLGIVTCIVLVYGDRPVAS